MLYERTLREIQEIGRKKLSDAVNLKLRPKTG